MMTITLEAQTPIDQLGQERDHDQPDQAALSLVRRLCQALRDDGVNYCHWKSNDMLDRSASGENDLDLLISRADATRFATIVSRLGFKQVSPPPEKRMPGVLDYFGYDVEADKWVHVHAHYLLIMGHDMTKNFRLPLEVPYLDSAVQKGLFRVPSLEFEYVIFVIRMVLKHSTWDAILGREGKLKARERRELNYLEERARRERVAEILKLHLPYVDPALFRRCVGALRPGQSLWSRIRTGHKLQTTLRANAVYSISRDSFLKLSRRVGLALGRRIFKASSKYRMQPGGALVAIVGGDGAGKSTAIEALSGWLSKHFETTRLHMGKPAWSWTTSAIRAVLKIGQLMGLYPLEASFEETIQQKSLVSPGYPYLIREVCRARDRYWMYVRARRMAARGKVVILDRFPLPQVRIMDGAQAEQFIRRLQGGPRGRQFLSPHLGSRIASFLIGLEESYYRQIAPPELLVVLRVPPHVAVQRKTEEDPVAVEMRSSEIWNLNWDNTGAFVVDAGRSREEVASEIKTRIWSSI